MTYPNSGKLTGTIPANPAPVFTRIDAQVDFHWGDGAPRTDMNDDDFGVRWTGYLSAPVTGTYQLGAIGLNAWELYIDDKRVAQSSSFHGYNYSSAAMSLEAGKLYRIRLDYHEFVNDAGIQLLWSQPTPGLLNAAVDTANLADAVVMVLGLSPRLEGEEMQVPVEGFQGGDRLTLDIPRVQQELLEKVAATGKPVVLVLLNGSAVSINWAHDHIPAIVEAWYPGQAGGTAVAGVLFGEYNPAGRLPVTFYKSADQLPPFDDYSMKERTYRYFTGEPLYPFGYGLSYTTFKYSRLTAASPRPNRGIDVSVSVKNTGARDGEEVVELYVSGVAGSIRSLEGFERVSLRARERKTVRFTLKPSQIPADRPFRISVGGAQPDAFGKNVMTTTMLRQR